MTPLLAQRPRVDRAFERMYQRFATDIYRYAYGVLRNQADAEDVAQTTFLNAYRALERGEQPREPLNWLITIAHNVCRQRFRQSQRRPQEVELDYDVADAIVAEDADEGPTQEDIRRALGHLAFNQRAAIVLREIEGRSYAEIAEVLGLSVSAVETLIFRARRSLREQLEGALTCAEAELSISKQLDGRLSRGEKSQLRAHLRECPECAKFARSQRAQRTALKAFGAVPLPSSLAGLLSGGATLGMGIAAKTAAVVVVASAIGAGGYGLHHELRPQPKGAKHAAPVVARHHAVVPAAAPAERPVVAVSAPPEPALAERRVLRRGDGRDEPAPAVRPSEQGGQDEGSVVRQLPPVDRQNGREQDQGNSPQGENQPAEGLQQPAGELPTTTATSTTTVDNGQGKKRHGQRNGPQQQQSQGQAQGQDNGQGNSEDSASFSGDGRHKR